LDTGVKLLSSFVVQSSDHSSNQTLLRPRTSYEEWLSRIQLGSGAESHGEDGLTLDYVIEDSFPGEGDDIPHVPVPFYNAPRFVHTTLPDNMDADTGVVEFFFNGFTQTAMLSALNMVQDDWFYTVAEIKLYSQLLLTDVFG
jgi:hypothetical protein